MRDRGPPLTFSASSGRALSPQPEAHRALRCRVCGPPQRPTSRHPRPDHQLGQGDGGQAPPVQGPDSRRSRLAATPGITGQRLKCFLDFLPRLRVKFLQDFTPFFPSPLRFAFLVSPLLVPLRQHSDSLRERVCHYRPHDNHRLQILHDAQDSVSRQSVGPTRHRTTRRRVVGTALRLSVAGSKIFPITPRPDSQAWRRCRHWADQLCATRLHGRRPQRFRYSLIGQPL